MSREDKMWGKGDYEAINKRTILIDFFFTIIPTYDII